MYLHTVPELALLIRERRQALGLSQAAVAARIGVSRQWLVAFEGGQPNVEFAPVLRALHLLGLRIAVTPTEVPPSGSTTDGAAGPFGPIESVLDRLRPPRPSTPRKDR